MTAAVGRWCSLSLVPRISLLLPRPSYSHVPREVQRTEQRRHFLIPRQGLAPVPPIPHRASRWRRLRRPLVPRSFVVPRSNKERGTTTACFASLIARA